MQIGTPWIFWTGVGLGLAGALGLAWALFADWLRGRRALRPRRRCRRCWYDMTAVPGLRCPECGHEVRSERALARSRRRWGVAAPSVLLLGIGAAGLCNARLQSIEWVPLAPSALLVRLLDDPVPSQGAVPGATPQDRIRAEVLRRYAAGELSLANRRILASKQFLPGLPPVSIRTRRAWPLGSPVRVELVPKFGGVLPRELEARATFDGAERIVAYHGGARLTARGRGAHWAERPAWTGGVQSLGVPPQELRQIEFEGRVLEAGEEIWRGRWFEQVRVAGSMEELFTPFASEELNEAVRESVEHSLRLTADRRALSISLPADQRLIETAVTLVVQFRHGDQVRASARLSWQMDERTVEYLSMLPKHPDLAHFVGMMPTVEVPIAGELPRGAESTEDWIVRIHGAPDLLETTFFHQRYWSGRFEIPLSTLLSPSE